MCFYFRCRRRKACKIKKEGKEKKVCFSFLALRVYRLNKPFRTDKTRIHSSRMRTIRCSGRLGGEGAVHPQADTPPAQFMLDTPPPSQMLGYIPPVDRMTDVCENITFPQLLLRTVTTSGWPHSS